MTFFQKKYLMLTKAALFNHKLQKKNYIVKYYYNLKQLFSIFLNVIYSCDGKAECSAAIL